MRLTPVVQSAFGEQIEFLQRLVHARSSNPFLPDSSPPDVPVEEEVAGVIQQELHRLGLPAAFPNRKSVPTFPTLIQGGSGINVVPGSCEAYGDVRLLPGLTADEVKTLIREQLERLDITSYRLDDILFVPAAETNPQAEIVQEIATAAETITGVKPRIEGSGPACEGWMFITKGIPTVCGYGVDCGGVHGADEWVDLESLRLVTEVYAYTILGYCGNE